MTVFFLSYSSELPPSVPKRQGSPSLLVLEEKSSKKRHCSNDEYHSLTEGEITCSGEKYDQHMQSNVIAKSQAAVVDCSKEVNNSKISNDIDIAKYRF